MKKSCLTMLLWLATGALSLFAQNAGTPPSWVNRLPKPENETYYFRVTHADGDTYENAYVRAFSMAILESSWKMGLPVDAKNDMAAIEKGVENNLSIRSHQSNIALNKVCEYQTKNYSSGKVHLFVLWQVAAAGNITPDFGYYEKCN